jgi:ABC-type arginine/histidine transport system permease subunit
MDSLELIAKVVKFVLFLTVAIIWIIVLLMGFILAVPFLLYSKPKEVPAGSYLWTHFRRLFPLLLQVFYAYDPS